MAVPRHLQVRMRVQDIPGHVRRVVDAHQIGALRDCRQTCRGLARVIVVSLPPQQHQVIRNQLDAVLHDHDARFPDRLFKLLRCEGIGASRPECSHLSVMVPVDVIDRDPQTAEHRKDVLHLVLLCEFIGDVAAQDYEIRIFRLDALQRIRDCFPALRSSHVYIRHEHEPVLLREFRRSISHFVRPDVPHVDRAVKHHRQCHDEAYDAVDRKVRPVFPPVPYDGQRDHDEVGNNISKECSIQGCSGIGSHI